MTDEQQRRVARIRDRLRDRMDAGLLDVVSRRACVDEWVLRGWLEDFTRMLSDPELISVEGVLFPEDAAISGCRFCEGD